LRTFVILRRLDAYGRPHRRLLVLAFAAMAVLGLTTGMYAWLMGPALRFLLSGGVEGPALAGVQRERMLWILPAVVLAIGLVKGLAYLAQFSWMGLYGQRVSMDLRRDLFVRMARLSPLELSRQRTGDLLSRFTSDVSAVETAATYAIGSYLRDSLQIAVLAAVALALEWRIALAAFVVVPLAAWPASRLTRSFLRRAREGSAGLGRMAAQLQEGLVGLRTIQAFNAHAAERDRFAHQAERHLHAMTRAAWLRGGVPGVMEILAAGALAAVLSFAVGSRALPPEALVSLLTAIVLAYQPVKDLGRVTQFAVQASVAGERLLEVLDTRIGEEDRAGARALPAVTRSVRLEDVHFSWGDRSALQGVTLELEVGKLTALVGPSGGGKSTVVALLLRFEEPSAGRIAIDGVDTRDATAASVRAQFALVTQDPLLFSGTVRDNIRFARPDASDAEVEAAAAVAQAKGFIRALPAGYDTLVGERGVRLSGGQKQRVCLARAVLANAPVLILDEATSNLDPQGEREVQEALAAVLCGRTALVIAHRLSAVAAADKLYLLDGGRLVESGSHRELLARGGLYARLWSLQEGRAA
jgi:subfamily B ATP-binding cassette protein MsbA